MLAGLDPLVILYMPCDSTQDDLLHQLPRHRGQADRPVVPRVLLFKTRLELEGCDGLKQPLLPAISGCSLLPSARSNKRKKSWAMMQGKKKLIKTKGRATCLAVHGAWSLRAVRRLRQQAAGVRDAAAKAGKRETAGKSLSLESAKQSQFPQPLLIRLLLQTLHQLRCPSLGTLQHLNVFLGVRGPKLNTGFEVRPHQCRVQGDNHFPTPAGYSISDTSQDAVSFLGHLGTLLAHIQEAVNQHPQVLFHQAAFQPLFPKPVALHGVVVPQVQDLALGLVEPHTIDLSPLIQPVQIPLQSLPPLKQINTPTQLGVICKLTEGAFDPLIQIIDKDKPMDTDSQLLLNNPSSLSRSSSDLCSRPFTSFVALLWTRSSTSMSFLELQLTFTAKLNKVCYSNISMQKFISVLSYFLFNYNVREESKPPLVQLEAISSRPIACYLGDETDPHLATTSFQAKQSQLPQPLLIRLLLQTLHQLRCPSLDTLQHLNVSLVVGGPKLNTAFEAAFQPLFPKSVALHGVVVTEEQDLALGLVKHHTVDLGPSIQPVQIPLQSVPALKQINTPTQLGVICKFAEGALDPFVQIIDKDIKQDWPQY
ncbi:hypothetical protein QYF61_023577 [Mycteria americana]|uniref:Uncharacterized protein n=1 Tax=Mycteria americana TaxID=33587 RepID=A0AAN7NVR1_MYCAM|nr:hypothetical protein QYF61_023577 [Mycteria americana]